MRRTRNMRGAEKFAPWAGWAVGALSILVLSVGHTSVAQAVPVELTSTVGGNPTLMNNGDHYSFSHALSGFNAATDTLTSATVTFTFADDGGDDNEKVKMYFDGQSTSILKIQSSPWTTSPIAVNVASLSDGLLAVVVEGREGDFYFSGSTLTVLGDRAGVVGGDPLPGGGEPPPSGGGGTVTNPEPASVLLMGLGLAGLGLWGRRRLVASKSKEPEC